MNLQEKTEKLKEILKSYPDLIVAFSGGVDSTLLLYVAHMVLGEKVLAITAHSPVHPEREIRFAKEFTTELGIRHVVVASREMQQADFRANRSDRCYVCKRNILADLIELGNGRGMAHVVHGANLDDLKDYRPGMKAARELGVTAPLVEAGLNKDDIRLVSRQLDLPTWNKPSMACLATRVPYGTIIREETLAMIDAAEEMILSVGASTVRVRHHGDIARIELDPEDFERILVPSTRLAVTDRLKALGFNYVTLDLEGYTSGSMNRNMTDAEKFNDSPAPKLRSYAPANKDD
jgi:uncharacterized protein